MTQDLRLSTKQKIYRKACAIFQKEMPDKLYLQLTYQWKMGAKLNLDHPATFNEKLNWLKLYDRKPEYTNMADKYAVREIVKRKIGEQYLIPLLGVYDSPNEIDYSNLPEQFVLKCTHDSGSVIICKNKDLIDKNAIIDALNKSCKTNYYWGSREWVYKNIKPRVIAEKLMVDESGKELKDYKIYNFNGKPYLIQVDFGRFTNHQRNLYDLEWNYIPEQIEYPTNENVKIQKPKKLDEMLRLASILSEGIPNLRTDFYSINNNIYFGELTFYQEAGFAHFTSDAFALLLGNKICLDGIQ